jgi:hypothetical protein
MRQEGLDFVSVHNKRPHSHPLSKGRGVQNEDFLLFVIQFFFYFCHYVW